MYQFKVFGPVGVVQFRVRLYFQGYDAYVTIPFVLMKFQTACGEVVHGCAAIQSYTCWSENVVPLPPLIHIRLS
jgi:hypothetical protein